MKKFLVVIVVAILFFAPFSACSKKSNKTTTEEKNFSLYFPISVTTTNQKLQTKTKDVLGIQNTYRTISFVADSSWTNGLFLSTITFNFSANQNIHMDFVATLSTNGNQTEIPLITTISNGKGSATLNPNQTLSGETSLELRLSITGGSGINGLIYDENNALTGFTWAIEKITFKAEHK